jgi:hypothetical protein
MSKLITSNKTASGQYRFDLDPNAGAVGAVGLGIFLPQNAVIIRFLVKPLVPFLSIGANTIAFTLMGPTVTTTLMVANGFAAFIPPVVMPGVDFNANPFAIIEPSEIQMNIAVAVITQGIISFTIWYNENDI